MVPPEKSPVKQRSMAKKFLWFGVDDNFFLLLAIPLPETIQPYISKRNFLTLVTNR